MGGPLLTVGVWSHVDCGCVVDLLHCLSLHSPSLSVLLEYDVMAGRGPLQVHACMDRRGRVEGSVAKLTPSECQASITCHKGGMAGVVVRVRKAVNVGSLSMLCHNICTWLVCLPSCD